MNIFYCLFHKMDTAKKKAAGKKSKKAKSDTDPVMEEERPATAPQQQHQQQQQQQQQGEQQQQQQQQKNETVYNITPQEYMEKIKTENISVSLQFLMALRETISEIVPKAKLEADELYKIGSVYEHLNMIHKNFLKELEDKYQTGNN